MHLFVMFVRKKIMKERVKKKHILIDDKFYAMISTKKKIKTYIVIKDCKMFTIIKFYGIQLSVFIKLK